MLTPPRPKSPPLNALKAFETAARLGGFKAAALELNVTPGAVAQHIKTLEAWAGSPLFERKSQGVRLTDLGSEVQADFTEAFDCLGNALARLRGATDPEQIRIAVLPSIAQLWLSSYLPRLRAIQPEVTISITALDSPPNLKREPYDISLFFREPGAACYEHRVCDDSIFPVCSSDIAARLAAPSDLSGVQFLHDAAFREDWHQWLVQVAPDIPVNQAGPTFSLYSLALQEAVNGAGVLIGHEPLVRAGLESGELVAPFAQKVDVSRQLIIETPGPVRAGSLIEQIIKILCN